MDYAHSNPNVELCFCANNMILQTDSYKTYQVATNARGQAARYHYCRSQDGTQFNGPIHVIAEIIKNVMASAMEVKIAALYINAQALIVYWQTLIDMGHPQPPTVIPTDNKTACGIVNGTIKQQRSKAIDM